MTEKQAPCCARYTGQLVREQGELRRVARMANRRAAKGLSIVGEQAQIVEIKARIAWVEAAIVDHEAEHADVLLPLLRDDYGIADLMVGGQD